MKSAKENYLDNFRDFTKYINASLRGHEKVDGWFCSLWDVKAGDVVVGIDFVDDFKVKDTYDLVSYDIEMLKMQFNRSMKIHLQELKAKKEGVEFTDYE